jgi:hypothetical protein
MQSILPAVRIIHCCHPIHVTNTGETSKRALAIYRYQSKINMGSPEAFRADS